MSTDTHMMTIAGSNRPLAPGTKLLGKADPNKRIEVSIYVRRNPTGQAKAKSSLEQLSTLLPAKRRYLTDNEFNAVYGADPADVDKVAHWAESSKLKVLDRNADMRRVLVEGTIADVNAAFGVQLNEYECPKNGKHRGREGEIHVPAELYGIIEGVFGLDTRKVGHARSRRNHSLPVDWQSLAALAQPKKGKAATPHANPSNPFPGTFFPPQVARLYNYPDNLDGTGQNIAIFAFNGGSEPDPHGGYRLAALKAYFEQVLGGTTPSIEDVVVHGRGNDPGEDTDASGKRGDATGEVMLDMCVVGSVAPEAKIFMYFTEFTTQGWVDALHKVVSDNNDISVISISYGNPEDDPQGAWTPMGVRLVSDAFQAAAAKGITICCASGDDGSSDQESSGAHVDFPASSPFVLGVGGTKLVASDRAQPTILEETVWNETFRDEGAGGGGVSVIFSKPSYQNTVQVPPAADPPHRIGRGVPDVSAVADPETGVVRMLVNGRQLAPIGGTSASAPLWAALIARLNQGLNARCGFVNPVLYSKFATGVLRDIVVGNNGAYAAGPGWDACTGLGSPDGEKLLQALSGNPIKTAKSKGSSKSRKARR
jgi:kumamolisin